MTILAHYLDMNRSGTADPLVATLPTVAAHAALPVSSACVFLLHWQGTSAFSSAYTLYCWPSAPLQAPIILGDDVLAHYLDLNRYVMADPLVIALPEACQG